MERKKATPIRSLADAYRLADYTAAGEFLAVKKDAPHLPDAVIMDSAHRIVFCPEFRKHNPMPLP